MPPRLLRAGLAAAGPVAGGLGSGLGHVGPGLGLAVIPVALAVVDLAGRIDPDLSRATARRGRGRSSGGLRDGRRFGRLGRRRRGSRVGRGGGRGSRRARGDFGLWERRGDCVRQAAPLPRVQSAQVAGRTLPRRLARCGRVSLAARQTRRGASFGSWPTKRGGFGSMGIEGCPVAVLMCTPTGAAWNDCSGGSETRRSNGRSAARWSCQ